MMDTRPAPHHDSLSSARAGLTCVIGDVHGQIRKLEALLRLCEARAGADARLLFIGDYVDRGPDSRSVVALLIDLQRRKPGQIVCLRGNHEAVVLAATQDRLHALPGGIGMDTWLSPQGGGLQTLKSYGVRQASDLPPEHLAWMATLPLFYDDGRRYFVHAGVRPERRLADQVEDDLLWIREPFLTHEGPFERFIVHGHTPVAARVPDLRANRLNIDSGAGYDGPLSAAIFGEETVEPLAFLSENGQIGCAPPLRRTRLP